ncbi:suppressor of cytokine signaling 7-like [Dunckerocampus dactyliophorus]|uniref:suppressor of cytokine signaling 7-like n=1 Tax=Dunckerocampus dactyliophorus TaxID=161453 RepID=UPI0024072DC5|nr:suppressor of cytokine signaling 7-like [Dunckerocampus dactyliophorus]
MSQEMSPDFVLMRLVSAAEYDHLDQPEHLMSGKGGLGHSGGFNVDSGVPPPAHGLASPHYSSPLPGKGELEGELLLTQVPPVSEVPPSRPPTEDFVVAAQRFVDFPLAHGHSSEVPGSRAQLMVFQNLLRSTDRILEFGLEKPSPSGFLQEGGERQQMGSGSGSCPAGPRQDQNPRCVLSSEKNPQWRPEGTDGSKPGVTPSGFVVCHRHCLAKWPPGLLDQALRLRLGLLDPRKNCGASDKDLVLALAQRLHQLGEEKVGSGGGDETVATLPRCSCLLDPGTEGVGPGEDPSETSDALLVLEGLGTDEVGRPGGEGCGEGGTSRRVGPVFSSGTLSGLMQQVHRLAGEAGVCTNQTWGNSLDGHGSACSQPPQAQTVLSCAPLCPTPDLRPHLQGQHQCCSQPQSRAATPKLGLATVGVGRSTSPLVVLEGDLGAERTPRGKSRKGGSLKVRLSKLFRTKSSGGGAVGVLDKRPSLASSTSSGGSLVDVWVSNMEDGGRLQTCTPPFTGETVSLLDVDISHRGANCLHPPTPPPPPRRSLSLLDDFGGPPQPRGSLAECGGGASMQSLPPRPVAPPPSLSAIHHSLSLSGEALAGRQLACATSASSWCGLSSDSFLRALPRPVPLRPNDQPLPPRLGARCPVKRPDAGNFASSLRELEKCGWYWGPMTWEDAEMKLKGKEDGSFLVRDSSDPRYILSLSFRSQSITHHTRMEHYRGTFSLWCHPKFEDRCHSVVEFIERAIAHSKNGKFLYFLRSRVPGLPPTPVQLLYPVSRFHSIKSLQHLCRFCIRQLVRIDHIQELPLPTPLIAYLRKFYYYDPEEEVAPPPRERTEAGASQT